MWLEPRGLLPDQCVLVRLPPCLISTISGGGGQTCSGRHGGKCAGAQAHLPTVVAAHLRRRRPGNFDLIFKRYVRMPPVELQPLDHRLLVVGISVDLITTLVQPEGDCLCNTDAGRQVTVSRFAIEPGALV